ncbi:MAG: hypothetical protein HY925_08220, partial [Elusimicrobia bacterium]|nr:hypothetical protein [Elusimicrobiota bacterium]
SPRRDEVTKLSAEIRSCGGSGGFLREEDPNPAWRENASADAYILSLDNGMIE